MGLIHVDAHDDDGAACDDVDATAALASNAMSSRSSARTTALQPHLTGNAARTPPSMARAPMRCPSMVCLVIPSWLSFPVRPVSGLSLGPRNLNSPVPTGGSASPTP